MKRVTDYFKKKKEKQELQKEIQIEILETMCTICKYLALDSYKTTRLPWYDNIFQMHFTDLKKLSLQLRECERYDSKREKYCNSKGTNVPTQRTVPPMPLKYKSPER